MGPRSGGPNWVLGFWEPLHCISEPIVADSESGPNGSLGKVGKHL